MASGVSVGVVANPASGRDIRRLVAGASVFGNADKAGMVYRLLGGLGAAGVERVLMMPASDGLSATLHRQLYAHARRPPAGAVAPLPVLEQLVMELDGSALDSLEAVARMRDAGVAAIVVLGGDGTHRVVAKACGDVPLCALSTGTNNAFPEMRETTVAGLATGLVAAAGCRPPVRCAARERSRSTRRRGAGPRAGRRGGEPRALHRRAGDLARRRRQRALRHLRQPVRRRAVRHRRADGAAAARRGRGVHVRLRRRPARRAHVASRSPPASSRGSPSRATACSSWATDQLAPGDGTLALDGERELERRRTSR